MTDDEAGTSSISVLVCDDHRLLADGLGALLGLQPDIEVVGIAGSVAEVVAVAASRRPDVVLMDYDLPDGTGVDATRTVLESSPATRVVILTSFADEAVLLGAIHAGATGFVTKHSDSPALADAVRLAAAGESVIPPDLLSRLLPRLRGDARPAGMTATDRELEILARVADGATNLEIARDLHLSPNTVRNHLARLYARLGARSRLQAVAIAVREGLLPGR
jgi:DNA-binding NarL/FixJ family response regulator